MEICCGRNIINSDERFILGFDSLYTQLRFLWLVPPVAGRDTNNIVAKGLLSPNINDNENMTSAFGRCDKIWQ